MNHIITFSFDFNDEEVKKALEEQAKDEVIASIKADVLKEFESHDESHYYYGKSAKDGLRCWIVNFLDNYIQEWKDEIIDAAADKLAERLSRTKRGKELLAHLENNQ